MHYQDMEKLTPVTVTIKYGDTTFYCEGEYDAVRKAIIDGDSLDVWYWGFPLDWKNRKVQQRITFFGDPDWVAVEL